MRLLLPMLISVNCFTADSFWELYSATYRNLLPATTKENGLKLFIYKTQLGYTNKRVNATPTGRHFIRRDLQPRWLFAVYNKQASPSN